MNPRLSGTAALLARTFGWRAPAAALATCGAFAACDAPLIGATAAALLLLMRGVLTAAQSDAERRALSDEIDRLQAALLAAQHEDAQRKAESGRAREEAVRTALAAARARHLLELRLARRKIAAYAQALSKRLDADARDLDAWLRPLRSAADILALVARDTLDNTPPAHREIVFDEESVDLRELIDAVVLLAEPGMVRKSSHLRVCIDRSVAACVLADRSRLGHILLNLLAYAIDTAGPGVVTLAARAESLNAGAQRIVIGISGPPAAGHARARRSSAFQPLEEPADTHEHRDLALSRVLARKMGGDITLLAGNNVGACVALHAPFTIDRHDWPVPDHERRWACVDIPAYEDRQAICELLKKLGITTLPSDAKPPLCVDFRFVEAGQPPSPHGEKRTIVVTRDALPGGLRECGGVTELSLKPVSWTALRRICGTRGETPVVRAAPVPPAARRPSAQPTILVTDDNEVNRKVLARQLDVLGYHCLAASSGDAALDVLSREAIDLLITDLQMPGMSGVDLARRVHTMFDGFGRVLPIVLLSANSDAKLADDDRALFAASLVKTSGLDMLDATLKRLLPDAARRRAPTLERYDFTTLDALAAQGVNVNALLREWQQSMERDLAYLAQCRASDDTQGVRHALHKLAGAVGIVGNRGLMNALQRASAAQRPADSVLLDGLVARITEHMQALDSRDTRRRFEASTQQ